MASLIITASVLAYDAAQKKFQQRRATKARHAARFSELEKDNAARIARLRENCACGGDHTAADHPGGGGRPMGDPDVDANSIEEGRWRGRHSHSQDEGGGGVRRASSMPPVGVTGAGNEDLPPPPPYEEFGSTARVGEEAPPMGKPAKRRFFWRSRKMI